MYNFALAFIICAAAYLIGDAVSNLTKAWIPSVFVTAVVLLIGYWTVIPQTVVSDSMLIPFGSSIGIYLLLVHMGTIISLKQLAEQWKTIVICLVGLLGMCLCSWLIAIPIIGKEFVVAGLPPLTGGIVAAVTMQSAAQAKGLEEAALFAIAMYCVQGFAGYPLTAVCLQLEGKKLLKDFRANGGKADKDAVEKANELEAGTAAKTEKKKLIPELPAKWNGPVMIFLKMGIVAWLAIRVGAITGISGAVWALILGVIGTTIGFLDVNSLTKANSYGIIMFALMMYVFDGLKTATPEMLGSVIGPMVILIVIGVAGMAVFEFVAAKLLKIDYPLALANGLTALYGFPPNAIITENTCKALGETPEEFDYLMSEMYPSMIVGGFTTVTITSVIIAGIFANWL
ncbi:MAG: hypothetical protein IKS25_08400 [Oscillospiraceae bacterium]|nr:hypothetical protein [Oscillospiraceae bacterium]